MSDDIRVLFRDLAGRSTAEREAHYARQGVATGVRQRVESLLSHDDTQAGVLTEAVGVATEHYLLSRAPSSEGRCGSYRLIRLIGNGGMGSVYLAERADGEIEQQVAIKFLHADADLPTFRERFLRERQILASLQHPGIARLLDAGHSQGQPYLVMEYVEGTTIDRYLAGSDPRTIVALFLRMAEAVAYAHRNLIIHRDLKPSNILVDAAGQPKLLDFGIAKLLDETEQTRTVERALTPEYASPEQIRGETQATTTDIYSLGTVLRRLLCGKGPTLHLDKDLAAIIAKATRHEPEERYASVDLLSADLQAWLDYRPVDARRGDTLYQVRKFIRRRWLPVAAALAVVAAIAGGFVVVQRERAVAENRFAQVRRLSKQMLDLDADISKLPGSTKARARIVTSSLEYLDRLRAEARDPELALELAAAYVQVARVQGVPITSNLGRLADAKQSLAQAEALIGRALAGTDPALRGKALLTAADISHDLMIVADTEYRRADMRGYRASAVSYLEQRFAAGSASQPELVSACRLYSNIALNFSNDSEVDQAARYAARAVQVARDSRQQSSLGKALSILANTARYSGDLDRALAAAQESRIIAGQGFDLADTDKAVQLAAALWREAAILGEPGAISLNRPQEAIPLLQRAFDIAESLAAKDKQDYRSRSYVSMNAMQLGDLLHASDPAASLRTFDQARQRVAEINNSKFRREEVVLLAGSAYPLRKLHRDAEARLRLDDAFARLRDLRIYPADKVELGDAAHSVLRAWADHQADTGDTAGAIRTYRELHDKALAAKADPHRTLRQANWFSRFYQALEELHARSGDTVQSAHWRQRRRDLWLRWQGKLPGNHFVERQLLAVR